MAPGGGFPLRYIEDVLADVDRQWRLVGTLPSGDASLSLQPALPPP